MKMSNHIIDCHRYVVHYDVEDDIRLELAVRVEHLVRFDNVDVVTLDVLDDFHFAVLLFLVHLLAFDGIYSPISFDRFIDVREGTLCY